MRRLNQQGLRFSMDDFGTGYSSLSYLKALPLHELKIDRSFVDDLPGDSNDAAIVKTILSMARELGLQVVAEGVETDAQVQYLHQHGCNCFQGYRFSQPLALTEWLARWAVRPA
jgi:EAL domain-containing protein (putative c-di-GMP-specific phosphodiesterase class I)